MVGQPAGFETENRLTAKIAVQRGSRRMSSPRNVELANVSSRRVGDMIWNQLGAAFLKGRHVCDSRRGVIIG